MWKDQIMTPKQLQKLLQVIPTSPTISYSSDLHDFWSGLAVTLSHPNPPENDTAPVLFSAPASSVNMFSPRRGQKEKGFLESWVGCWPYIIWPTDHIGLVDPKMGTHASEHQSSCPMWWWFLRQVSNVEELSSILEHAYSILLLFTGGSASFTLKEGSEGFGSCSWHTQSRKCIWNRCKISQGSPKSHKEWQARGKKQSVCEPKYHTL